MGSIPKGGFFNQKSPAVSRRAHDQNSYLISKDTAPVSSGAITPGGR